MRLRFAATGAAVAGSLALPGAADAAEFMVTSNANSGTGSLRGAIASANANPDRDTITFAASVTSPITLTTGQIPITRSLVIDGPGAGALKVVAPTDIPLFVNDVDNAGITVEIEGLTLEGHSSGNGSAGGGLRAGSGSLTTVRNCVISGSTAANQGGAIFVENTSLAVIDSTITGNTAGSIGGGIFGRDAKVSVSGSTIAGNKGTGGGGIGLVEGISSTRANSLTITDSTITGNTATTGPGGGIGVYAADGPIAVSGTTIAGNGANNGGGGAYFGYVSDIAVSASTISGNSGPRGGGLLVFAPRGSTTVSDSTISGNDASSRGGGIYSFGYYDKPVSIQSTTIAANSAAVVGGGIFRYGFDGTGPNYAGPDEIGLRNTIVANNSALSAPDVGDGPLASPTGGFRALNSLVGSTSGANLTELTPGTNKLNLGQIVLGPLADNGGPTKTMLPAVDGPAIDSGIADGLATDQRGLPRTAQKPAADGAGSDGTDIGAVELADAELIDPFAKAARKQKVKGDVRVVVEVGAGEAATGTANGSVKLGKRNLPLEEASVALSPGATAALTLTPGSKKAGKKILRALKKGKKAKASVEVTIADGSGHQSVQDLGVKLKGKKRKPKG